VKAFSSKEAAGGGTHGKPSSGQLTSAGGSVVGGFLKKHVTFWRVVFALIMAGGLAAAYIRLVYGT
jgi:hypothetical protein